MPQKNYSAQQKHLRTHYVRFPLDLKPDELEEFRRCCLDNGTTPTAAIKTFIASYCEETRTQAK